LGNPKNIQLALELIGNFDLALSTKSHNLAKSKLQAILTDGNNLIFGRL